MKNIFPRIIFGVILTAAVIGCIFVICYFFNTAGFEAHLRDFTSADRKFPGGDQNRTEISSPNALPVLRESQQEAFLWIDRKNSLFVVTLGSADGINPGARLGIFEGDTKIDTLVVQNSLSRISYGMPAEKSMAQFPKDRYRVVVE